MAETFIPVDVEEEVVQPSFLPTGSSQDNNQPEDYKKVQASMAAVVNGESGDYTKDFDTKIAVIERQQESIERSKATDKRLARLTSNVQKQVDNGVTSELLADSVQFLVEEKQRDQQFALEREYVQKYEDFKLENPAWADLRVLNKDLSDAQRDQNTKDLIIRNALEKKAYELEAEDSFLGDTVDILTDIATVGAQNFISFLRAGDYEGAGSALRAKGMEIRQLRVEEIPAAMDEFYEYLQAGSAWLKTDDERALRHMRGALGTGDTDLITAEESILSLLEAPGSPILLMGRKGIAKLTAKLGGGERVAADASLALRGEQPVVSSTVESVEEAIELALPVRVSGGEVDGLSPTILADLEANQKALDDLKALATPDRLDPE